MAQDPSDPGNPEDPLIQDTIARAGERGLLAFEEDANRTREHTSAEWPGQAQVHTSREE